MSKTIVIGAALFLLLLALSACQPESAAESAPGEPERPASTAPPKEAETPATERIIAAATDTARDVARNPVPNVPAEKPAAAEPKTLADYLPNLGPAPEISNDVWINSSEPLRLTDLRGKVVLIEFWTFG